MEQHLVEIHALKKAFQGNPVLRGIDLSINSNQLTVLIGPSGCGKSTLLRCLNGIEAFDEGRISIAGFTLDGNSENGRTAAGAYQRKMHQLRSMVGMVFQSFNLFPHMSTLDNVAYPPAIVKGIARGEARLQAFELLKKVGLADKGNLFPNACCCPGPCSELQRL